jgi:streptogramin lyase
MEGKRFARRPNAKAVVLAAVFGIVAARAQAQNVVAYPIPTADGHPSGITAGPDGNIWFTELDASRIGRMSPAGAVVEFPTPTASSGPREITAGPDGNLWFTELLADKIGRITPTGHVTEFPLSPGAKPIGIAAGPDGNVWFTEWQGNRIGRISPTGAISEFPLPGPPIRGPNEIVAGPDGALWFAEGFVFKIGRITTSGALEELAAPDNGRYPFAIAVGADGNLWVTDIPGAGGSIFRLKTDGSSSDYVLPPYMPSDVASGPDGNLWFTLTDGHVGRITPAGQVSLVTLPAAGTLPEGIAAGPDDRIWFTEPGTGRIGALEPSASCTTPPAPDLRIDGLTSDSVEPGGSYTLSWTSTLGGQSGSYRIFRSDSEFGGFQSFAQTSQPSYEATTQSSDAGRTLRFRVVAQRECGLTESDSEPSNTVSLSVSSGSCPVPGRPQLLVDGDPSASVAAGETFQLSWSDALDGRSGSYQVLRSTNGGQSYANYDDTGARQIDVFTTPADAGTSWMFEVIARAACGENVLSGPASAPVSVSVAAASAGCAPDSEGKPCVTPVAPLPPAEVRGRRD